MSFFDELVKSFGTQYQDNIAPQKDNDGYVVEKKNDGFGIDFFFPPAGIGYGHGVIGKQINNYTQDDLRDLSNFLNERLGINIDLDSLKARNGDTELFIQNQPPKQIEPLQMVDPYIASLDYDESMPQGWSIETYDVYNNDYDYNPATDSSNPDQRFAKYIAPWNMSDEEARRQMEHYSGYTPIDTIKIYRDYNGNIRKIESNDLNSEYSDSGEFLYPEELQSYLDDYANDNRYAMIYNGRKQNGFRKSQPIA